MTVAGGQIRVQASYLPRFPREARAIKGSDFDKPNKTWSFPEESIADVRKLLLKYYGEDGTLKGSAIPRVDVLVNLENFAGARRGVFALGRPIANRGRDGKFYLGQDVMHTSGTLPAELNQQTPDMIGYNTAVLCVKGVPRDFAMKECAKHPDHCMKIDDGNGGTDMLSHSVQTEGALPTTKAELSAYKNALLKRLAQVQRAMNDLEKDEAQSTGLRDISEILDADCPI